MALEQRLDALGKLLEHGPDIDTGGFVVRDMGILTFGAALWCVCNRHQTLFQRITAPSPLLWRPHVTNCHQFSSGATFAKYTNSIVSITYTHFLMSV